MASFFVLPSLIWQLAFFVLPLVFLLVISFWEVKFFRLHPAMTIDNWAHVLSLSYFWSAYGNTILLALASSIIASIIGFPVAYALSFVLSQTVRQIVIMLLFVPFFTSYLVRIFSWQLFLADNGIINSIFAYFGITLSMLNTPFGTLIGLLTLCLPLVILLQYFGLKNLDKRIVEASYNLHCSPLKTVFYVIIPHVRAALLIAVLFAFILSFGDFVSVLYLGGSSQQTMVTLITDFTKSGQQWPRASVVAIIMIITLLITAFITLSFAYKRKGT